MILNVLLQEPVFAAIKSVMENYIALMAQMNKIVVSNLIAFIMDIHLRINCATYVLEPQFAAVL